MSEEAGKEEEIDPGPTGTPGKSTAGAARSKRQFGFFLMFIVELFLFLQLLKGAAQPDTTQDIARSYPNVDTQDWMYLEIAKLIALVGILFMRRWGVYLYGLGTAIQFLVIGAHPRLIVLHLIYVINLVIGIAFWKRMK